MEEDGMEELKKCPFCGGEAEVVGGNPHYWVFCKTCDVESGQSATIEGAIRKWNTRKPMEQVVKRLEKEKIHCEIKANVFLSINENVLHEKYYDKMCSYGHAIKIVKAELN